MKKNKYDYISLLSNRDIILSKFLLCIEMNLGSSYHLPEIAKHLRTGSVTTPNDTMMIQVLDNIVNNIGEQNHKISEIRASVEVGDHKTAMIIVESLKSLERLTGIYTGMLGYINTAFK